MKAGVIVDVEATPAFRTDEVNSTRTMIDRVEQRFDLKPSRLIGDTAYGTAEMLGWMVDEKAIEPHVPVWDKTERHDGTFSRSSFEWREAHNEYRCPGRQAPCPQTPELHQTALRNHQGRHRHLPFVTARLQALPDEGAVLSEHADAQDRATCSTPGREVARQIAKTPAYVRSRRQRKKVEVLFAHLKRILGLRRLRLRGPCGAHDEFLMAATAQTCEEWRCGCCRTVQKWGIQLLPDGQGCVHSDFSST